MAKLERYIKRLKDGDKKAFDYIYEMTNKMVYFTILYIVGDKMYAEDILQEVYIKAINSINQYKEGGNFSAWINTIGKNMALNHIKRQKRETLTDFAEDSYKYGTYETEIPFIFELAAKVLDSDEYEILMLCQVAGYKRREVSEMLSMPIGTVTWKNNNALKKLKENLQKEGGI